MQPPVLYGLLAEFDAPGPLTKAAQRAYDQGYRKMDAYSPVPVHGLPEALGMKGTILPFLVLAGAMFGALAGFGMQYFACVIDYPLNIGGKPNLSWPSFIPITFELSILFGSITAILGMLFLNGLPRPYHPVFNVARFATASRDRFFLCIEAVDPLFNREKTEKFLETLNPNGVFEVED